MKKGKAGRHKFLRGHALGMSAGKLDALERSMGSKAHAEAKRSGAALRRTVKEIQGALQTVRRADAVARAAFLLRNSRSLAQLAHGEPRAFIRMAMGELPPEYEFGWSRDQMREAKWWIEFEARLTERGRLFLPGPSIDTVPNPLVIGAQATITGIKLGTSAGSATLVDCNGNRHALTVQDWNDTSVRFNVPASIAGIPFDCLGRIELTLADGTTLLSERFLIDPQAMVMFSSDSFHDSDWSVRRRFSTTRNFTSAQLPTSFREVVLPEGVVGPHAGSVAFSVSNVLVSSIDGGAHLTITAGPFVSGNALVVSTRITDDYVWNFTIRADFFIIVPNGIQAAGWSVA